jgi:plastin-1
VDGNKTLTLALVWQLMRFHVVSILKSLSKDGKDVTEDDMIRWANNIVAEAGKQTRMQGFKDPSLRDSLFLIDLLAAVRPRTVNYDLVTSGVSDTDAIQNAKYAISVARKIGATIFLLPEDILEVKPKMLLTFVGSLMAVALNAQH